MKNRKLISVLKEIALETNSGVRKKKKVTKTDEIELYPEVNTISQQR